MFSLRNITYRALVVVLVLIVSLSVQAATYYVNTSAVNDNGDGSQATPKKYIASGLGLMSSAGGDTVIIMPGIYADANDKINSNFVANGQPGAYNVISFDAYTNGLLYPVRVEAGSVLETAGSNNTRAGANIVFKLGASGSLYSDPGSATATTEPLWPWPLGDRMKADMCDESSTGVADRDWCATNKPLTQYIWELLGNAMPDLPGATPTMPAPTNAKSVKN